MRESLRVTRDGQLPDALQTVVVRVSKTRERKLHGKAEMEYAVELYIEAPGEVFPSVLQKSKFGGSEIHDELRLEGKLGPILTLSWLSYWYHPPSDSPFLLHLDGRRWPENVHEQFS